MCDKTTSTATSTDAMEAPVTDLSETLSSEKTINLLPSDAVDDVEIGPLLAVNEVDFGDGISLILNAYLEDTVHNTSDLDSIATLESNSVTHTCPIECDVE